jgi:hypothetical protein
MIVVPRDTLRDSIADSCRKWGASDDRAENVALDVTSSLAVYSAKEQERLGKEPAAP